MQDHVSVAAVDLEQLLTDLARHYRSKEEASAQAKWVDLSGDSLDGFAVVCRPPQFQHSLITWKQKTQDD